jgi:hypothetical protein
VSLREPVEVLPEGLGPPPSTSRLGTGLLVGAVAAAGVGGLLWGSQRLESARVGVEAAWLSSGMEGERLERVPGDGRDVYYHVRLTGVSPGRALTLECEWFDPEGVTVRHSRYETRVVDHDPWPTHCRCPVSASAPGSWRVLMSLGGRELSETVFAVDAP